MKVDTLMKLIIVLIHIAGFFPETVQEWISEAIGMETAEEYAQREYNYFTHGNLDKVRLRPVRRER
jgi:hypothetical protein